MKLLAVTIAAILLAGCAAQPLYQWGGYEEMLYAGYKNPNEVEAMRIGLEEHIETMEATGQKVPPGLYAELGTLYLQAGSSEQAIAMYTHERETWPESRGLMDAMISTLERREQSHAEVSQ